MMTGRHDDGTPAPAAARLAGAGGAGPALEALTIRIGLLTGGDDRSYALGLTGSLAAQGVSVEFVGSDKLDAPELHGNERIRFLNLRGDQREDAPLTSKIIRLSRYYLRLLVYAIRSRAPIFHILWNNKFEYFDRTFLMAYYRLCGRKTVLTAHNVNAARRDSTDSVMNRATLRAQYALAHHIFVHTEKMKEELRADFKVPGAKVSVIPFGINDTSPRTALDSQHAKRRLGLDEDELAMLFFGQIAPYKGLEYLVEALPQILSRQPRARLIIAGKVKRGSEDYWAAIERQLREPALSERVIARIEHIPDTDVELYFKAADVLVVPYVRIFQSGVPFLSYSFGLPVIATDVGALGEEIIDGETGFVCAPRSPVDLARTVDGYARSRLYRDLDDVRPRIMALARERHSWTKVAEITRSVYASLIGRR